MVSHNGGSGGSGATNWGSTSTWDKVQWQICSGDGRVSDLPAAAFTACTRRPRPEGTTKNRDKRCRLNSRLAVT
eukprot:7503093-Alexandrium_andersonii.AAC.1